MKTAHTVMLIITLLLALTGTAVAQERFTGEWEIRITGPETAKPPYQVEIKYPVWMKIEIVNGKLSGTYIDQYGLRCTFPMIKAINDSNDLLFVHCGTTKHPESHVPVHRAKLVDGTLRGMAFTSIKLFEWEGRRVPISQGTEASE